MQKIIINTYLCTYCQEPFTNEQECLEHEKQCSWNEECKGCFTCANRVRWAVPNILYQQCSKNIIGNNDSEQERFYTTLNCEYWKKES